MLMTLAYYFCILLGVLYIYLTWNFNYFKNRDIPGPKPNPYLGTFPGSALFRRNIIYDIDEIYKKYRHKFPFVGVFLGRDPQILVINPTVIKDVLIRNFKYFNKNEAADTINKATDPILGRNPFMLSGEEWREKRAEITPAFSPIRIKAMYPLIQESSKRMIIYLNRQIQIPKPNGMEGKELAAKFTTDVVSSCIYGLDSKAFSNERSIIREMGSSIFAPNMMAIAYFTLLEIFPFISKIYKMPFVSKRIEIFFTEIMKEAIRLRQESKIEQDDYLNYLLQLRKKKNLADIEMASHTITFFADGFETSSIVISYMLYALGKNKVVQEKLRNEINQHLEKNGELNFDNTPDLLYLDQVFNETLRMYPPAATTSKMCTEQTDLEGYKDKKFTVEKDMTLIIPIYSVHYDPEFYPNPNEFNPDRFSVENGGIKKYKDLGVFLPFGDGPRICLGMRFATVQAKTAVIEVIRNFEVSVNDKTKEPITCEPTNFLFVPIGGLWLDFKAIK